MKIIEAVKLFKSKEGTLGKLEIPVLIAGGTTDLQVPIQDAEWLQAANDRVDLLIVENMKHVLKRFLLIRQKICRLLATRICHWQTG